MADIRSTSYSETDASNTQQPPNGWPSGMAPNQVEPTARAMMGAIKRFYNNVNATVTSTGGTSNFVLAYGVAPSGYVPGDSYLFRAHRNSSGGDTLNVNSLGAMPIYRTGPTGPVAVSSNDVLTGQIVQAVFDLNLNSGSGGFSITSQMLPKNLSDLAGLAVAQGDIFYANAGPNIVRLPAPSTSGFFLAHAGPGNNPAWQVGIGAGISTLFNYIGGLGISNNVGTPNTKVDIAAGQAMDSTNVQLMTSNATKTVDFTVNGANGLDTGAIGAGQWYAILIINGSSGTAVMATLESAGSAISPTMPSGYSFYRYLGSVKTDGSSHILGFKAVGNVFYWATQILDISTNALGTSQLLFTLSTPLGIKTQPLIRFGWVRNNATAPVGMIIGSGDETSVAPDPGQSTPPFTGAPGYDFGDTGGATTTRAPAATPILTTDTSARIWARASVNAVSLNGVTRGWIDPHVASIF